MIPYLALFGFFAFGAVLQRNDIPGRSRFMPMLALGAVLIAVVIGLRYQVGADWRAYEAYYRFAGLVDLDRVVRLSDPGYQVVNWIVQQLGLGLWAVNLICGAVFSWGLVRFAKTQPEPWLAVVVAIPYLVTVVAMGYTRQAVAIGILMAGLAAIIRGGSVLRYAMYVLVAALFHRTAVLALPLVIFASERNRLLTAIGGLGVFILIYDALLAESVDGLVRNYIEAEYNSQGAVVRVGMSVVAAALFLWRSDRFGFSSFEKRVWKLFSWATFGLLVLLLVLPSSTAVDRMALYMFPLQIAVLSRVPIAFPQQGARSAVILYSLLVQLVWLNFATHAEYWVPYQLFPF